MEVLKLLVLTIAIPVFAISDAVGVTAPWGTLGIFGVLAWYLWYDTTVAKPAIRKEIKGIVKTFTEELKANREEHRWIIEKLKEEKDVD